ncbi:MAG: hypothetical protein N3H30_01310 [Candidatus Micrarchaeota archaeon]|nr:hypothetical protein [Candidatus Micrarchaeota archaeon]
MVAQAQKRDETLTNSVKSVTREVATLAKLGNAVMKCENSIPTKTGTLLEEVSSLREVETQGLIEEAYSCERLLQCIGRWNR